MSFTQDELHSLNSIIEQKLAAHKREMDRSLEQHLAALRRDLEARMNQWQHDLVRRFSPPSDAPQRSKSEEAAARIQARQQARTMQTLSQEIARTQREQQQQLESVVERALAAQLLAIEQLFNQRVSTQALELAPNYLPEVQSDFAGLEVQTELPWDDLVDVIDRAIEQRIGVFNQTLQSAVKDIINFLSVELNRIREELQRSQQSHGGEIGNVQEIFASIQQLEHIIESMQVAMNANQALISNRLYHHQQLPPERAHPGSNPNSRSGYASSINGALSLLREQEDDTQS